MPLTPQRRFVTPEPDAATELLVHLIGELRHGEHRIRVGPQQQRRAIILAQRLQCGQTAHEQHMVGSQGVLDDVEPLPNQRLGLQPRVRDQRGAGLPADVVTDLVANDRDHHGQTIAGGILLVNSGVTPIQHPGNALLAFTVDGK